MANNDYLEELLEESIKAQNRTNYTLQAMFVFFFGSPIVAAWFTLAYFEEVSDYTASSLVVFFNVLGVVNFLIFFVWILRLVAKGMVPKSKSDFVTRSDNTVGYAAGGYSVPAATVKRKPTETADRAAALFATPGRRATGADLNIARYFSTDEYTAWQLSGRPNLEDWVDAGRPELLTWLEENSEN